MNCLANGGSCGADNDCCSGNCSSGKCTSGNGGDGCGCPNGCCETDSDCGSNDCDNDGCCVSDDPIIVDLSGNGFPLTSAQNGVEFDFSGKGQLTQMAWTVAGSNVGWLALDRNGNGRIDNGTELFSNVTPQSPPGPKLGFRALAVYDQPANGGNGDGVIDQRDAVFPKLLVWVDRNHNGVSEPGELLTMQQAGIQSISVHYEFSNWVDAYGNQFRYRSKIAFTNGGPAGDRYIYDVLLTTAK